MLNDFLTHLKDWVGQNKLRLSKIIFYVALVIGVALLIYGIVDSVQKARYEKRVNQLDQQFKEADAKAKDAEARAAEIGHQLDAKKSEVQFWQAQGQAADKKVAQTRTIYLPLKETYENTRTAPIPSTPVSCADLCRQLSELGYKCE